MLGRHTPPAPLWDGEIWMRLFYLEKRGLSVFVSPLERGLKGCVMERGAVWVEVFLLLFGEEEFLGFSDRF